MFEKGFGIFLNVKLNSESLFFYFDGGIFNFFTGWDAVDLEFLY